MSDTGLVSSEAQRRFHRFPVEGNVHVYSGTQMWTASLLDVSLRGVLVAEPAQWNGAAGSRYRLDLRLAPGLVISMSVDLARVEPGLLGFACRRIDLDSFARLKRLVELNLGNVEMLNRELSALG